MTTGTKEASFVFRIQNDDETTSVEHEEIVPTFLCKPSPSQRGSQQYMQAFIEVNTVVNGKHHAEVMGKITTGCVTCQKPAKDALKSPMSFLHLEKPVVVVHVTQVCGDKKCEAEARKEMQKIQQQIMQPDPVHNQNLFGDVSCDVCQAPTAKRCAGCGSSAYCSKECQKAAWKGHKRDCYRRKIQDTDAEDPVDLPYEVI